MALTKREMRAINEDIAREVRKQLKANHRSKERVVQTVDRASKAELLGKVQRLSKSAADFQARMQRDTIRQLESSVAAELDPVKKEQLAQELTLESLRSIGSTPAPRTLYSKARWS
jgi:hypothetical protein